MPPKGWRKNADGSYPQPNREAELTSIDEILFPRTVIQRLSKDMLLELGETNSTLAKDSVTALQRSATVFVSHMMYHARVLSRQNGRKTVNAQDILGALERAGFSGFVPEVKQKLSSFEASVEAKKKAKTVAPETEESEAKRLKADSGVVAANSDSEDEVDDNTEEMNDTKEDTKDDTKDDTRDEIEEEEVVASNPIALSNQEADELEGPEPQEPEPEVTNNEENEDNED